MALETRRWDAADVSSIRCLALLAAMCLADQAWAAGKIYHVHEWG
jgi:hypothetical protein